MNSGNLVLRVEIIVEEYEHGFYAYSPDLKGVHACCDTKIETFEAFKEIATDHLEIKLKYQSAVSLGAVPVSASPRRHIMASMLKRIMAPRRAPGYIEFTEHMNVT